MLKDLRKQVARQMELPPFVIFSGPVARGYVDPVSGHARRNAEYHRRRRRQGRKFGKPFVELIKKYCDEKDIVRPQDMVVKSVVNKSGSKVFIIQSIDRQMDFEDIARARDMDFDELLTEIEAIVHSGTRLNVGYYVDQAVDEDKAEEIYLYFKEDAETDSLDGGDQGVGRRLHRGRDPLGADQVHERAGQLIPCLVRIPCRTEGTGNGGI